MLDSGRDFDIGRVPTIYIENHDHKRFMLKAGGRPYWYLTQPYIIALCTCAGAPLLYNGQEFGQDNDMPEEGDGRVIPRPVEWQQAGVEPGPTLFAIYPRGYFAAVFMNHLRETQRAVLRQSSYLPRRNTSRNTTTTAPESSSTSDAMACGKLSGAAVVTRDHRSSCCLAYLLVRLCELGVSERLCARATHADFW